MSEQQNIEYKQSWRDEYLKWVCGFSNAQGGTIYIGKDDNGPVVGLSDARRLLEDVPNKIVNYLGIVCEVNLHEEGGMSYWCSPVKVEGWKRVPLTTQTTKYNDYQEGIMTTKKTYSKEFKEEAVRLAGQHGNQSQTARDLGLQLSVLRR